MYIVNFFCEKCFGGNFLQTNEIEIKKIYIKLIQLYLDWGKISKIK